MQAANKKHRLSWAVSSEFAGSGNAVAHAVLKAPLDLSISRVLVVLSQKISREAAEPTGTAKKMDGTLHHIGVTVSSLIILQCDLIWNCFEVVVVISENNH